MPSYADPTIVQLDEKPRVAPAAYIVLVAGILSVLAALGFMVMSMITQNKAKDLQTQISAAQAQLRALEPTANELTKLDRQATNLHTLFDNQKEWQFVFNHIENSLYKNMKISRVALDDRAKFTLGGTTKSYVDYAKIYQSLTDDVGKTFYSSVRPASITRINATDGSVDSVQFTFDLVLQPSVLNARKNYVPPQAK